MFFEATSKGAATHALVIGVGAYQYLDDGFSQAGSHPQIPELGQLTSASVSAIAFANWLVSGQHSGWTAPLATVDLLVNSPDGISPAQGTADPTIDNIQQAFGRWLDRCEEDPDNIAILYFCGHGVQRDQQILLASDFGRFPTSPFRGAFSFDATRLGLLQHQPKTQCVIVDACRLVLPEVWESVTIEVSPLISANVTARRMCEYDLTLRAAPFESARARVGQVAYLTSAVLHAFSGQAATHDDAGDWVVRTDTVAVRIDEIMSQIVRPIQQQPVSRGDCFSGKVLFRLDGPPQAQLRCRCQPLAAASLAALVCEPMPPPDGGVPIERAVLSHDPWHVDLDAGYYRVWARFADGSYPDHSRPVFVQPPVAQICLQVES